MNSWKPEIRVIDDPKWYDNAVRFKTRPEAEKYASDLFTRWTTAEGWRVVETDDPVNAFWDLETGGMVWEEVCYTPRSVEDHEL
jgi:hypothetical protein